MKSNFIIATLTLITFSTLTPFAIAQRGDNPRRGAEPAKADNPTPAEEIFSGPQAGEELPEIELRWFEDKKMSELTALKPAVGSSPLVAVFVTERTRPAFAVIRLLTEFQAKQSTEKLQTAVIFLTADPAETEKWLGLTNSYFPKEARRAIAEGGQEGPGNLGINRDVTLTVIVAKEGKVTANYALVQPSLNADGPKILTSIVESMGGEKVPTIDEVLGPPGQPMQRRGARN